MRIGRSGRISVYTGAAAMGQSTKTMLAQIAADQFGVAPDDINVVAGDTAYVLDGPRRLRQPPDRQRRHLDASRGEGGAGEDAQGRGGPSRRRGRDLSLQDGRVIAPGSNLSIGLGDLAREATGIPGYSLPKGIEPGLEQTANFMPTGLAYSNASHCVEVEVDIGTGAVHILRYVVVSDCGRLINPMIVEGQIVGGVVHGIGNALFERMVYDENAQPLTTNFADYLLPTATELPRIEV